MGYAHGVAWTDEKIIQKIKEVMSALNLNRMPSNNEIKFVTKSYALSNAISKRGGFKSWAEKLSLEIKESETKLGREYERQITDFLIKKGYEVRRMTVKHPFDLLVNENIKIDVKSSNLFKSDKGNFYTFNLERYEHNCDIFICICLNENKIEKILVIPSKYLMSIKQLSIGNISKYDRFIDRFDYINIYDNFYKNEVI